MKSIKEIQDFLSDRYQQSCNVRRYEQRYLCQLLDFILEKDKERWLILRLANDGEFLIDDHNNDADEVADILFPKSTSSTLECWRVNNDPLEFQMMYFS